MDHEMEFRHRLMEIMNLAREKGSSLEKNQINEFFREDHLTEEQMTLVYQFLNSNHIEVKGYSVEEEKKEVPLTSEEEEYLRHYREEIEGLDPEKPGEWEQCIFEFLQGNHRKKERMLELLLPEVIHIARRINRHEVLIQDLIQEGNMSLVIHMDHLTGADDERMMLLKQAEKDMIAMAEELSRQKKEDHFMVEQVQKVDHAMKELTEELGEKVGAEELAMYLDMSEEELKDILRLAGE